MARSATFSSSGAPLGSGWLTSSLCLAKENDMSVGLSSVLEQGKTAITTFLFSCVASITFAQGDKCVSLENDILRLQCFDEAYDSSSAKSVSPEDAVVNLAELVNYQDQDVILNLTRGEDPCAIQSLVKFRYNSEYGRSSRLVSRSSTNLGFVERIGDWRSTNYGVKSIGLYTTREFNGSWVLKFRNYDDPIPNVDMVNESDLPIQQTYEDRDAPFDLLVSEYSIDSGRIREALRVAIESCKKS